MLSRRRDDGRDHGLDPFIGQRGLVVQQFQAHRQAPLAGLELGGRLGRLEDVKQPGGAYQGLAAAVDGIHQRGMRDLLADDHRQVALHRLAEQVVLAENVKLFLFLPHLTVIIGEAPANLIGGKRESALFVIGSFATTFGARALK